MSVNDGDDTRRRAARDPAWDVCRIVGMSVVATLHAAIAYMLFAMPGLLWIIRERGFGPAGTTRAETLASGEPWTYDAIVWTGRAIGVALISVIAGYFSARAIASREPGQFVRERVKRLGVPMLFGMGTVLVFMYLLWATGWVVQKEASWDHIVHVRFAKHIQPHLYGLGHLWYLQYLIIYACGLAACVWIARRCGVTRVALARGWVVLAMVGAFAICVSALLIKPGVLVAFRNGFVPDWPKLMFFSGYFLLGVIIYGSRRPLEGKARTLLTDVCVVGALIGAVMYLPTAAAWMRGETSGGARMMIAVGASLLGWCAIGAIVMLARPVGRWMGERAARIAEASYWVYMVHVPLQGIAILLLYFVDWPFGAKFVIVLVVGLGGAIATWPLVRGTWIGRWLGSREVAKQAARTLDA
jgi:glucans biosynthesis protein C